MLVFSLLQYLAPSCPPGRKQHRAGKWLLSSPFTKFQVVYSSIPINSAFLFLMNEHICPSLKHTSLFFLFTKALTLVLTSESLIVPSLQRNSQHFMNMQYIFPSYKQKMLDSTLFTFSSVAALFLHITSQVRKIKKKIKMGKNLQIIIFVVYIVFQTSILQGLYPQQENKAIQKSSIINYKISVYSIQQQHLTQLIIYSFTWTSGYHPLLDLILPHCLVFLVFVIAFSAFTQPLLP